MCIASEVDLAISWPAERRVQVLNEHHWSEQSSLGHCHPDLDLLKIETFGGLNPGRSHVFLQVIDLVMFQYRCQCQCPIHQIQVLRPVGVAVQLM